jgi:hypothetical protein
LNTRIKVVIFNHNQRQTADCLWSQLSNTFDTALLDSQSDREQVSNYTTHRFENLYWAGCWNKAWELFPDSDVIWGIGADCTLNSSVADTLAALHSDYPFGVWSPAFTGRAHEYMKAPLGPRVFSVRYLEGMAFAISRELWQRLGSFDVQNQIGHGLDLLACYESKKAGLTNVLDSRISMYHPPGISYDLERARAEMYECLERKVGPDWQDKMQWSWGNRITFAANKLSELKETDD